MLLNTQHRGPPLPSCPTRSRLAQHPGAAVEVPWLRELHMNSKCQTSHQHPGVLGLSESCFRLFVWNWTSAVLNTETATVRVRGGSRAGGHLPGPSRNAATSAKGCMVA